jgi:formate dehydrogenase beta subunit
VEDSEFQIEADSLIPAIGQKADLSFLSPDDGIDISRRGNIKVDKHTMMTSRPGVFAAGDAVTGPLTVVHAVAGGKQAAKMIHEYVTSGKCGITEDQKIEQIIAEIEKDPEVLVTPKTESRIGGQSPPKKLDMRERVATFREVDSGFSQESSYVEASRCLRCYHLVFAAFRKSQPNSNVS